MKDIRFVVVREPERKVTLASALLKTITGRDTISARTLYVGKEIKFSAPCKIWFNTNWKFSINDISLFTSNRLRIIPFRHHFDESEQDRTLKDELSKPENLSGVFLWCLEGLERFRQKKENVPDEIKDLIKEYEIEENSIARFISKCMEQKFDERSKPMNSTPLSVYEKYTKWCDLEKIPAYGKRRFYQELRARNLMKEGMADGSHYKEVVFGLVPKVTDYV